MSSNPAMRERLRLVTPEVADAQVRIGIMQREIDRRGRHVFWLVFAVVVLVILLAISAMGNAVHYWGHQGITQ